MSYVSPTLQTRLEAFLDFKVKHPRLEEVDRQAQDTQSVVDDVYPAVPLSDLFLQPVHRVV